MQAADMVEMTPDRSSRKAQNIETPDRVSRQMKMMSSRRLEAIRANGNQILNPQQAGLNKPEAASTYKKQMETTSHHSYFSSGLKGPLKAPQFDQHDYEAMDAELSKNQNLHLVPCRWERSGWRYVQVDPADQGFFNNPNRVNNFGIDSGKKRFASSRR